MVRFVYKAVDANGREIGGELESLNRVSALRELTAQGTFVKNISEVKEETFSIFHKREQDGGRLRVRPKHLANLTRQLAISLEAGLTLMTAMQAIGEELDHKPSRELLVRLEKRVQQGGSFSEALADYPTIFSPMYIRLVKVGETGGALDVILSQLADILERQLELKERVKTASIYPAVLMMVGIVSVVIIVTAIVPRIVASLGTETFLLPLPTRMLMGMSNFIGSFWW